MPPAMTMTTAVHEWLVRACMAPGPREFVALLAGPPAAGPGVVTACEVLPNTSAHGDAFEVEPHAFARAESRRRAAGLVFRGFAHGHGDGAAAPSLADRRTLWRDCVQLIGAHGENGAVLRAYWLLRDGTPVPLPWTLVAEAS